MKLRSLSRRGIRMSDQPNSTQNRKKFRFAAVFWGAVFLGSGTWIGNAPELLAQSCVCSDPKLNFQIVCTSVGTQTETYGFKVTNYGSAAVSIQDLCFVLYANESVSPLNLSSWGGGLGTVFSFGGGNLGNVNSVSTSLNQGALSAPCSQIPGHYANQAVTFCITNVGSGPTTIPGGGGYWISQSDDLRIGRNNGGGQMDNGNFADDYSHLGDGISCPDTSTYH